MLYISDLKKYRLYKGNKLNGINKLSENKDPNKGQLILHLGNNDTDIISFFNSRIFKNNLFKSYSTARRYRTNNKRKMYIKDLKEHFAKIKKETKVTLFTKVNYKQFKGNNLVYDITDQYNIEIESINNKKNGLMVSNNFIKLLEKSLLEEYDDTVLLINMNTLNVDMDDIFNITKSTHPLTVIDFIIKKKLDISNLIDKNITIVVFNPNNRLFYSYPLTTELYPKRQIINQRSKSLINLEVNEIESNDEMSNIPDINDIDDAKRQLGNNMRLGRLRSRSKIPVSIDNSEVSNNSSQEDSITTKKLDDIDKANEINDKVEEIITLTSDNTLLSSEAKKQLYTIAQDEIKNNKDLVKMDSAKVVSILNRNEEFNRIVSMSYRSFNIGGSNAKELARTAALQKRQNEILNDKNISNVLAHANDKMIDKGIIKSNNINDETLSELSVNSFDKSYIEKQFNADIINVLKSFNDNEDISVFISDISSEDSSDFQTKKTTLNVKLKDTKGINHKLSLDIPKIYNGRYMMVNGSKKILTKQLLLKPVVKTAPDTVQITTNYNKMFVKRFGRKDTPMLASIKEIFNKFKIEDHLLSGKNIKYSLGNSLLVNSKYLTSVEYNNISNYLLSFSSGKDYYNFNQKLLLEFIDNDDKLNSLEYDSTLYFPVGYTSDKSKLILANFKDYHVYYKGATNNYEFVEESLSRMILLNILMNVDDEVAKFIDKGIKANDKLTYTRVNIINKTIPLIILLSYENGLINTLNRYNIDFEVLDSNPKLKITDNKVKLKFKDKYLVYDNTLIRNSLLLSGLHIMDINEYNLDEMETKEPYLDLFQELFNSRNVAKGIHNALSLAIDPITKEVLEDLGLPTNIFDVLLYSNTLLEDMSYNTPNDMNVYRIRGAEQISGMIYKIIAESYKNYKDSLNSRNSATRITVPKDILIKTLMESHTVEENSELNPTLEVEVSGKVSYKGPNGLNLSQGYTPAVRSYDRSMKGILSMISPDSSKIGEVRQLSYNPAIVSTRGYLDVDALNGNESTSLYSPSELLNNFTSLHADPPRISMQVTQQKHLLTTRVNSKPLIGTGVEKSLAYQISDTFATKAKYDGKVDKIDTVNNLMMVSYDNGKKDIIDIGVVMNKNSGGGFFLAQSKDIMFKEGQKFKNGEILAKNPNFFIGDKQGEISYAIGKLSKVALAPLDGTYEDSSMISSSMSEDMTSKITMKKDLVLGTSANLSYIVKEGQNVKTGDSLAVFENEFDDDSINQLLNTIGDKFEEEIQEISNKVVKSKYTGVVQKINIYYNREIDEFSSSLQKLIKAYISKYEKKNKIISDYMKDSDIDISYDMNIPSITKMDSDKIKGNDVDGLLIEFYIEYEDNLSTGDKVTYYTALKTVISDVFPEGEEPFAESDPEEHIEAVLSPLSVISRMTQDVYLTLYTNKALINLKKQIGEMLK
ncbi:hypothetical protein FPHOBKDP_00104 [Listeria phage LPJP1]|nr:hypothetical protein FPHOBKDP_00104 [Listeria phage LPJP1]